MDIKDIVMVKSAIKLNFPFPFSLKEMDGNINSLFFQIGKVLQYPITATVDLQAMN